MKLLSFLKDGATHTGALSGSGVIDLTALGFPDNMNDIITGGTTMLQCISEAQDHAIAPALDINTLEFANVTRPQKILCIGLNYKNHAKETKAEIPKDVVFFSKFNDALTPAGQSVFLPPWLRCFDYEAELVIVMGKPAWNIAKEQAMEHIFGYTCGNDLSARDGQFLSSQWLAGKALPNFGPAGPVITTADSFDPNADNAITCQVNGVVTQSDVTSGMIFDCAEIVSTASRYFKLEPGDLIFTGTPSGVILGKDKDRRVWLKPGDVVKVTIEGLGTLTTPLV
jgi:2-keto-4-pentenoate hydratase/2-oxohepta-3-ene-1,7-dioic acid hydratase in catechol pathway